MTETKIDLSKYQNVLSRKNQIVRMVWSVVWGIFARPLPRSVGSGWKRLLLRLFGAKIAPTAIVYSSAKVYYPANLVMDDYACIASDVDCYNVALIHIGANSTVSQGAYLCTASHDITNPLNPLITAPIVIEDQAWVAAGAFIGMVVTEALVRQVPVIASKGTPWHDLETYSCGIWCDSSCNELTESIGRMIAIPVAERKLMGERGRKLVMEKYTIDSVAARMRDLYSWILGEGSKPSFVTE